MQSVGTQLRAARLQAGLSLDQISAKTCISARILQALEGDDLTSITSAFFYKSFVRQFCREVGLPVESLTDSINTAVAVYPEPLMPGRGEAVIRSAMVRPPRRPRKIRWLLPAASLATVLFACSGFYAYWERNHGLASHTPHVGTVEPNQARNASPRPDSQSTDPFLARPQAAVPAEPDGHYRVQLSAVERTWLSIKADGKQVYAGTLEVDQTKVLEGRQEGQMRTGNAGGVNIVFNGKPIGVAGPHGSVRTVVFTRDNYQVLLAPVHTAMNLAPITFGGWLLLPPVH